jgi:hypothetical protein
MKVAYGDAVADALAKAEDGRRFPAPLVALAALALGRLRKPVEESVESLEQDSGFGHAMERSQARPFLIQCNGQLKALRNKRLLLFPLLDNTGLFGRYL